MFRILAAAEAVGVSWATPGDGRRLREGARAIRPHHRHLPGRQAPRRRTCWSTRKRPPRRPGTPRAPTIWTAPGSPLRWPPRTQCELRSSTRRTTFSCTAASHSPGSTTRTCICGGPAPWRPLMADGADPLVDVVDGQRSGQAHGASFTLPPEAEDHRQPGPRGRRQSALACPTTSSVTSSSTPDIWCRTGPSRGAGAPMCSSSWSSRRSSAASTVPTWGSPAGSR